MSGFHIYSGNQLEGLADVLAGFLREPLSSEVLEPEVIVVPSRGLERWLKLRLARVNGVSANLEFPFPQAFLEKKVFAGLRHQIDSQFKGNSFVAELLLWKIFFILGEGGSGSAGWAEMGAVENYIKRTGDELSRYQLALELADLFDRYLLFRPDLIRAWERGENPLSQVKAAAWQMALWRDLGRGVAKSHFAALQEIVNQLVYPEFFPEASNYSLAELKTKLPARVFLFGFATLPFNYLDLFKALSRLVEVHLFHVNPCAEFWGDQFHCGAGKHPLKVTEARHSLLASWGRLGRDFFDLNASLESDTYREYFVTPEADTLLAALQRQILFLQLPAVPLTCAASDSSFKINLCHGRQREVEILYDTILDALESDPELKPDDIFVMAPDISIYSPYIGALFARLRSRPDAVRLDYTIVSARSILNLPEIKALLDLLRLFESRFLLSEVFDLFSQEVVRQRFSVSEAGLDLLSEWLQKAAVNWGFDGDFRKKVSSVDFSENSIFWGLDRLLTGYGLAGSELYDAEAAAGTVWYGENATGFLPLAGIEGSEALVLGSFISFVSTLRRAFERLSTPLPAHKWRSELERLLDDFIWSQPDDDSGWQHLRQAFAQLEKYLLAATASVYTENSDGNMDNAVTGSIRCETILMALERELQSIRGDSGFFRGGITFSSILPLRAVPAQMICLIGLNDGDFPRSQRPKVYDLIAARPRAGDRNARDEDRYLFLETLLAARKTLVLSYIGRDPKDNHLRSPAVVVSELIDYIEEHFVMAPESDYDSMREFLICDHPPQPFSYHYFHKVNAEEDQASAALFSYDRLQAEIATEVNDLTKAAPDFFGAPLADVACDRVELSDLISFFNNPAKFFLQERLKISPGIKGLDHFTDSEPFKLDGLATYKFNDELVTYLMADGRDEVNNLNEMRELKKRFAASGLLPPLAPGRVIFTDKVKGAQALANQLKPFCATRFPILQQDVAIQLSDRDVEVAVTLTNLFQDRDGILRQILFRPAAELKKKDLVKTVIMSLGLEILTPLATDFQGGIDLLFNPLETRFHTLKDKASLVLPLRSAVSARVDFAELLEVYFAGLKQPLSFLPELSLLWFETWSKERSKKGDVVARISARDKVRNELTNERNYTAQDEAYSFVFADRFANEDFWLEFEALALKLGPVFMLPAGN